MEVKQREIRRPGVSGLRACGVFAFVSSVVSLSTVPYMSSMDDFVEVAPVALVAYRSDLGAAGEVAHPVGVVAEPHRPVTLRLSSGDGAAWLVDGSPCNVGLSGDGSACEHVFSVVGATVRVRATARKLFQATARYDFDVRVKYVRRELRSLGGGDRAALLEAMRVLWSTPTAEGRRAFGAHFRGLDHFAEKHLRGSAALPCDHWHDGAAVANHHVAVSLEFERSLQAVNPETCLHYWDYVQDDATKGAAFADGADSVFADDWFGAIPAPKRTTNATTEDGAQGGPIPRGPWAYLALPRISHYGNAYGLARSPWNLSPSPWVLRLATVVDRRPFPKLPGCGDFEACYEERTFGATMECMNGLTHGSVHINVGGHWGVDGAVLDAFNWTDHREQFLLIAKGLWRKGLVRCPSACGADADEGACACDCSATFRPDAKLSRGRLEASGALAYLETLGGGAGALNATDAVWADLHAELCKVGTVGDMYTSASPNDPTFWVIPPNLERLLMRKRLLLSDFDETWAYAHNWKTASDTNLVCDWSQVDREHDAVCETKTCPGHGEFDVLPFTDLWGDNATDTNRRFYDRTHPLDTGGVLPYVYDSLHWPVCGPDSVLAPLNS